MIINQMFGYVPLNGLSDIEFGIMLGAPLFASRDSRSPHAKPYGPAAVAGAGEITPRERESAVVAVLSDEAIPAQ